VDSLRQERAEPNAGEDVVAGGAHEGAGLVLFPAQCIGDGVPLCLRLGLALLDEDRLRHRRHRGAAPGRGVHQGVAHPVNPAALPVSATIDPLDQPLHACTVEHAARGGPQALVIVGDRQFHAAQAAVGEAA
jgi:hypothetical protein